MAPSGRRVTDSREEIVVYLRDMLSEDHANLLADGVIDPSTGTSTWYTDLPGEAMRYDDAPPERQAVAYQTLQSLMADIRGEIDTLSRSSSRGDQLLGRMLTAALEVPGTEAIHIVGDRPVLAGWGHLRSGDDPPRGVIGSLAPPRRTAPPPPPSRPAVHDPMPMAPVAGGAAVMAAGRSGALWPFLILWLLLALLIGAILVSLLGACGVGLPGGISGTMLVGRCPIPVTAPTDRDALMAEAQRSRGLEDTIRRLEIALQDRVGQCSAEVAAIPPPPPPVTLPDPEPEVAETIPEPPEPEVAQEDDEEFDRRLDEQGGQSDGETMVTLLWNTNDDLDLILRCPDGKTISYQNPSACGAVLDVDVNEHDNAVVQDAVENIVFQGPPPSGHYAVLVNVYKTRASGRNAIPFRVRLVVNGTRKVVEGVSRPPHHPITIAEFTIP